MRIIFFVGISLCTCLLFSQEQISQKKNKYVKSYWDLNRFTNSDLVYIPAAFGLGFVCENSNLHEFSIAKYSFENGSKGFYDYKRASLGVRYEYALALFKMKDLNRFSPYLGLAVGEEFGRQVSVSDVTTVFNKLDRYWLSTGEIIPSVVFDVSSRFFTSLNTPIRIISYSREMSRVSNPAVPVNLQQTVSSQVNFGLINIGVNAALGYRF